jgi:nucleoside-diphosphate-sugar epimerase
VSGAAPCLVTGATGFIGGHVARRLASEGVPVRALVRAGRDTSALERVGIEPARGDLTDRASLMAAAAGCSHVVHCAALVSDWATVAEIERVNVGGTQNIVHAAGGAVGAGVERFVHISSTDVYGHPGTPGVDELQTPGGFANWYAETKLAAEREVRRAQRSRGLPAVVLRPATVYGPGSVDVVGDIARAIRGRHMLLIDRGRAIAGLCYVENLVDAVLLALRHDAAPGQTFNVTDRLPVTWRQFTDDLAAGLDAPPVRFSLPYPAASALGSGLEHGYRLARRMTGLSTPPLLSRQAVQVLGRDQDFSNAKLMEVLGWTPRIDYADGLAATLDWLRTDYLPVGRVR